MAKADDNHKFQLTFRGVGGRVPEILRLKMLLKSLLRQYHFKVLQIVELGVAAPEDEGDDREEDIDWG
jgi:hypothetical protein